MQNKFLSLSFTLMLLSGSTVFGQYQMNLVPRQSPDRSVSQTIGFAKITVDYGSPVMQNRQIWGDLVPYDTVWRAGANNATTFISSEDLWIDGQYLPSGKFGLFIIPREVGSWTLIFSQDSDQWGAFKYDSIDDQLRLEAQPRAGHQTEHLTYELTNEGVDHGYLNISWGILVLQVRIDTKVADILTLKVEEISESAPENTRWIVFLQGAEFLVDHTDEYELAKAWIMRSEDLAQLAQEWDDRFYPKVYIEGHQTWIKAKILAKLNYFDEAIEAAKIMTEMEGTHNYYDRNNSRQNIDQQIEEWTAAQKP